MPLCSNDLDWEERLKQELNEAQYRFATAEAPAILGLAGPGSGKTRALVYRAAHIIKCGVSPHELLLLTFTNKAAEEMKERLHRLLGFWPEDLWAGTFHSIGARLLRRHAAHLNRQSNFSILDEDDSRAMLKDLVKLGDNERTLLIKRGLLASVISHCRNADLSIEDVLEEFYPQYREYAGLIRQLYEQYQSRKEAANAFDFDDLLLGWLELFTREPSIRESYRRRFKHVLVDEFQDTNLVQGRIVDLFAGESSICVVGDDAQSIYAFRFAEIENILSFPKKYPGCLVIRMEQNYRSTPEIVALADCSISFNRGQLPKKLYSCRRSGEKPWVVGLRSALQEAWFVGERIQELQRSGIPLREIAVLYRSSYLATELELELVRRGIRYRTYGGLKFLQKAHIKDVLAFLKVLCNPRDEVAWRRIVTMQPGMGPAGFEKLWSSLKEAPDPVQAVVRGEVAPSRRVGGWENLRRILAAASSEREVPRTIEALLREGYQDILLKNYPDQFEERLRGIERLAAYGARFDSLEPFLEALSLEEVLFMEATASDEERRESVCLSTVHSAKGKEWEAVFIIGLNDGHFPGRWRDEAELEEERRLFYVAVTRTRRYLFLITYWDDRRAWGGAAVGTPSLFLRELPANCYQIFPVGEGYLY